MPRQHPRHATFNRLCQHGLLSARCCIRCTPPRANRDGGVRNRAAEQGGYETGSRHHCPARIISLPRIAGLAPCSAPTFTAPGRLQRSAACERSVGRVWERVCGSRCVRHQPSRPKHHFTNSPEFASSSSAARLRRAYMRWLLALEECRLYSLCRGRVRVARSSIQSVPALLPVPTLTTTLTFPAASGVGRYALLRIVRLLALEA